jgi:phospholipid/cholesterol/gamma-HCH transport system substrate-binding protein
METLNKAAKNGDPTTSIGRIIDNIERVTGDLKEITGDNKEKINEIVDRIRNLSKNIDNYINEESLAHLDKALKNIDEITTKVNKGEGTLGRLINDEQTIEELNSAIVQVNKFLGGANQMETSVDFHSEYLSDTSQTKSFLGLRLQPGLDRYYELMVVDDPQGVKRSESVISEEDGVAHESSKTITFKNKLKYTALFAKNFWDLTIKGGLIENNGGVGVDYYFMTKKLRFSVEFFNFQEAQLRVFARYNFFKGVYAISGGDNILGNDDGQASFFVGAGIFITNDDLKSLASKFAL